MPTEAYTVERQKEFKFRVEVDGWNPFAVQEFDPGERTHGISKHQGAGQNHPAKESSGIEYGDAILKVVVPLSGADPMFWEKMMNKAQDPKTGNGARPSQYQFMFHCYELDEDGSTLRTWEFIRGQVSHYKPGHRNALNVDKDAIEEVHISYESRELIQGVSNS